MFSVRAVIRKSPGYSLHSNVCGSVSSPAPSTVMSAGRPPLLPGSLNSHKTLLSLAPSTSAYCSHHVMLPVTCGGAAETFNPFLPEPSFFFRFHFFSSPPAGSCSLLIPPSLQPYEGLGFFVGQLAILNPIMYRNARDVFVR